MAAILSTGIIDSYIKTLAKVLGSEEEARMKIYSASTKHYFAFGALVRPIVAHEIRALPRVIMVVPDTFMDDKNKHYGGEPFINGQAVPYDPKYHEVWVRNNAKFGRKNRQSRDGTGMQQHSNGTGAPQPKSYIGRPQNDTDGSGESPPPNN